MLKPTLLIAATTLLCMPAFAQCEQTQPARTLLAQIFKEMKVPFAIGPGIDGDITLSPDSITSNMPFRVETLLSTLPYKTEYRLENGVHIVRRKPDNAPALPVATTPSVNVAPANVSVAPPKITLNPTTVLSYRDALQWELTRTEIEHQRIMSSSRDRSQDELQANELAAQLLRKRLAELDAKTPRPSQGQSYVDAVRLELLHAEMEQARLLSVYNVESPMLRENRSVIAFLKRRIADMESKIAQPARKTAKR